MERHFLNVILFFFLLLTAIGVIAEPSLAETRERLNITAMETEDYTRLIFHRETKHSFTPYIKGNQLIVPFEKAFWSNLSSVTKTLAPLVSTATISKDGTTLNFTLTNPSTIRLRPFIGEHYVGFDLVQHKEPTPLPLTTKVDGGELVFEKAAIQQDILPNPEPFELAQQDPQLLAIDNTLVAAEELSKEPEQSEVSALENNDTATQEAETTATPLPAIASEANENQPIDAALDSVNENTSSATALNDSSNEAPIIVPAALNEAVSASEATSNQPNFPSYYEITFNWDKPVASAIFRRGKYSWFVFNEYTPVDMDAFISKHSSVFKSGEQINNRKHTILRLENRHPYSLASRRNEQNWLVILTTRSNPPTQPLPVNIKSSNLHGTSTRIQSTQFAEPLRIIDPIVGDEMVVIPSYEAEAGVGLARVQIDYTLLKTAQGVALALKADEVQITPNQFGITISGPTNRITSNESQVLREKMEALKRQREEARKEKLAEEGEASLLKFHSWKGEDEFIKQRQKLENDILQANWENKNSHRLALAQFYLAHSFEIEALAVIESIKASDATYGQRTDVLLVEGAANYLAERYQAAIDSFSQINLETMADLDAAEVKFWKSAATLKLGSLVKMDKFIARHPLKDEQKDSEQSEDKIEITQLILDTSSRLLKMIKKIDPKLATSEEIQTLESTARFVSSHYQDEVKRFGESEVYRDGDAFEAADESQWWNTSGIKGNDYSTNLNYLANRLLFLKDYPTDIYNNFALLALEERLENNDINSAERILETFRESKDEHFHNSLTYLNGLFYAKDEEIDLALETWEPLKEAVFDRYNRARSQFASTGILLRTGRINLEQAIENFNSIRMIWRGDILELNLLKLLGEFYMDQRKYMQAFKTWREVLTNFPGSEDALLIAKKMNQEFVYLFNSGGANELSQLEALTLYYEFRELTPVGRQGDQMILKLVDRLVEVDLLDRATALLTHLVRFRLIGEEKHLASTRLAEIYLMGNQYEKALDALNATKSERIDEKLQKRRRYIKAKSYINLKQNNQALALLRGDETTEASFLRADIYWRNKVWRKVVDELEYPFKEIIREERLLTPKESESLNKIALSYALLGDKKRLKLLEEDFRPYTNPTQQKLLAFVADDDYNLNYRNLEGSLGLDKMESFIQSYMNTADGGAQTATTP